MVLVDMPGCLFAVVSSVLSLAFSFLVAPAGHVTIAVHTMVNV